MGNRNGGIGLGGILVIVGILLVIFWSFWWGLIIGLVGLVIFGGFAKGKWYELAQPRHSGAPGLLARRSASLRPKKGPIWPFEVAGAGLEPATSGL